MARKKITSIAPSSIRDIAKGMGTIRNLPPRGPRGTSWDDTPDYLPPEVYVARTPPEGIAALVGDFTSWTGTGTGPTEFGTGTGSCRPGWAGTGTGTGTGHWGTDDDLPGYAECELYRIVEVCHRDTMLHLDKSVRVYNVSTTPIAGDIYIPVMREKFGRWIAAQPGSGIGGSLAAGGRLSVTDGAPVTGGSGNLLYYVPYVHDKIALWNGSSYSQFDIGEPVISAGTGINTNLDIYAYGSGSNVLLETRDWTLGQTAPYAEWHGAYGVRSKIGDPTRRYLGIARRDENDDVWSLANRINFLWNAENRIGVRMSLTPTLDTPDDHAYTVDTWRPWNNTLETFGTFRWVVGFPTGADTAVLLTAGISAANDNAGVELSFAISCTGSYAFVGPGNSTVANLHTYVANSKHQLTSSVAKYSSAGYNVAVPIQKSAATGTTIWYSDVYGSFNAIGWF